MVISRSFFSSQIDVVPNSSTFENIFKFFAKTIPTTGWGETK